jgi:alpha-ketoglutarate-dependent taurine dioxygenase
MDGSENDGGTSIELDGARLRPFFADDPLPLVVEPAGAAIPLPAWGAAHRDLVHERLLRHGAILFRGFPLSTPADFEAAALALCPTLFGEYGDLPREGVSEKVYGSTPYPADKSILFHNESSHLPRWPMKQLFFCVKAAEKGGETPLLDCRAVVSKIDPAVLAALAEKGLMYVRNFAEGIDVPWQKFFHTDDRALVEERCRAEGMTCEWLASGGLRVRQRVRAVAKHPRTGETVFFNQIQLHHVSCLPPRVRKALRAMFREDEMPRNVYYGDGTPIDDRVVDALGQLYLREAKKFPWREGDVLMLDNMLVAHARMPYSGPRKIVVAMGDMMSDAELTAA